MKLEIKRYTDEEGEQVTQLAYALLPIVNATAKHPTDAVREAANFQRTPWRLYIAMFWAREILGICDIEAMEELDILGEIYKLRSMAQTAADYYAAERDMADEMEKRSILQEQLDQSRIRYNQAEGDDSKDAATGPPPPEAFLDKAPKPSDDATTHAFSPVEATG